MKKYIIQLMPFFLGLLAVLPADCQERDDSESRVKLGSAAGIFRISHDDFGDIYKHRWSVSPGGFVAIRAIRGYNLLVKYRYFEMDGKNANHPTTEIDYSQANWREQWYNIGIRKYAIQSGRMHSFYGFGLSLFRVSENPDIALFSKNPSSGKIDGNGFFLEVGFQRRLSRLFYFLFEFEVTSAGVNNSFTLENRSIGGFFLGAGIAFHPL